MIKNILKFGGAARRSGPHLWPSSADPWTRVQAFKSHWDQVSKILENGAATPEHVSSVFNNCDQMILLLLTEVNGQDEPDIGPILDTIFCEDILDQIVKWSLAVHSVQRSNCLLHLIKIYEGLVTQSYQCLLVHKPILLPLLTLLNSCAVEETNEDVEKHFVLLLNQICTKIANDSSLLEFFFNRGLEEDGPRFLVFTLMIPYLYHEGDIGQLARDAILLTLAVSQTVEPVGHFIAEHSNFCPVLATGLSACYSELPRQLTTVVQASDDWHCVTQSDIDSIPALGNFYGALVFCNAVVQVGHGFVLEQLLEFIHQGFLVSVIAPALYENSLGLDELVSATAYLELCLRTVTEPALIRKFVQLVLMEQPDGHLLIDTLMNRIKSNSRLSLISLALFKTLFDLNCEDIMLHLILKYLLPCTHILSSQAVHLKSTDFYGRTADKFLSLIPVCTKVAHKSSSRQDLLNDNGLFGKENGVREAEEESNNERMGYMKYLNDARVDVENCYSAVAMSWSVPYDAQTPHPSLFRDDTCSVGSSPEGSTLSRTSSIRRSRPNSYFTRRHTSMGTNGPVMTPLDLSILGPDEVDSGPDGDILDSPFSIGPSATPRYKKRGGDGPWATDYFKLTYEDDDMNSTPPRTPHDSQGEESDAPSSILPGGFVLRGWSQVEDIPTFTDILNRVRTQNTNSLQENIDYLNKVFDHLEKKANENKAAANITTATNNNDNNSGVLGTDQNGPSTSHHHSDDQQQELIQSKDSGIGETNCESSVASSTTTTNDHLSTLASVKETSIIGIPIYHKGRFSAPNIGPFLNLILDKLEKMVENSMYCNLQLTGVISRIAIYPLPLLSSFMLNPNLLLQPSVNSLFQVLAKLQKKIDGYAISVPNFDALLLRGRKFMLSRSRRYQNEISRDRGFSHNSDTSFGAVNLGPDGGKVRSASDVLNSSWSAITDSPVVTTKARSGSDNRMRLKHRQAGMSPEWTLADQLRTKNYVYSAIILEEWMKELAGIAQEHAVVTTQLESISPPSSARSS